MQIIKASVPNERHQSYCAFKVDGMNPFFNILTGDLDFFQHMHQMDKKYGNQATYGDTRFRLSAHSQYCLSLFRAGDHLWEVHMVTDLFVDKDNTLWLHLSNGLHRACIDPRQHRQCQQTSVSLTNPARKTCCCTAQIKWEKIKTILLFLTETNRRTHMGGGCSTQRGCGWVEPGERQG